MRLLLAVLILAVQAWTSRQASADGLIYQLPDDGAFVEYEVSGTYEQSGRQQHFGGTVRMSSVGAETFDNITCRWIEFNIAINGDTIKERKMALKLLIPESELTIGKSPVEHVKKIWFQVEDQPPRELDDFSTGDAGMLPVFLAGPVDDAIELEASTVDGPLGKLMCKRVAGSTTFELGTHKTKYTFINGLHENAPFGVVKMESKSDSLQDGKPAGTGTMNLTLKSIGKDAKADIPNGK